MNISASQVKDLREKTGAGMMDCKHALAENNGDIEAAIDWLRATQYGSRNAIGASRVWKAGPRPAKRWRHGTPSSAGAAVGFKSCMASLCKPRARRAGAGVDGPACERVWRSRPRQAGEGR